MTNINKLSEDDSVRSIYISSYIPRKCGVATFTKDLTTAINNQNPFALAEIIAMDDIQESYEYPWEVKLRMYKPNIEDYINGAHYINQSSADVVNLQHEFGLFGGVDGDYILALIDEVKKPIVTVFHTILPEPDEHKKFIMKRIIEKSSGIVVLTNKSKEILTSVYECKDPDKIAVIYHGVPDVSFNDSARYKKKLKIKADYMVLLSGLMGPGKGVEYAIEAMTKINKEFKNVQLYVVGESHPDFTANGKKDIYRAELLKLVKKHKLTNHVKFINKFIDLDQLMEYFKASDFYLTPHLEKQQSSSGTLSKAMGAGKICISTPYYYAEEMLSHNRGILVPFKDSDAIANSIIEVLKDPELMKQYENNAYKFGKLMQWPNIANKYIKLFKYVKDSYTDTRS